MSSKSKSAPNGGKPNVEKAPVKIVQQNDTKNGGNNNNIRITPNAGGKANTVPSSVNINLASMTISTGTALVCASCPEAWQDQVSEICLKKGIQKAYGRAGDMVNSLSGKDWIGKWQAKVVMAVVTKAQTLNVKSCKIICIQGGPHCNTELSHQPLLLSAIKTEMNDASFRVKVEWMDIEEFLEEHGEGAKTGGKPTSSIAAPGTKNNTNNNTSKPSANNSTSTKSVPNPNTSTKSAGSKDASTGNAKQTTAATASKSTEVATDSIACGDCGKEFSSVESLNQHQGATGHSSFGCPGCNKTFTSLKALAQHTDSSKCGNGNSQQSSKQANKPSTTSNSANQKAAGNDLKEGGGRRNRKQAAAQDEVSSDEGVSVCGECQREFASEEGWAQHQRATGHADPECSSCGKCFISQTSMEQHCRSTGHFPLVNLRARQQ